VLADCGEIQEAAVIGRQDAKWGEVPVAVVVRKEGAVLDDAAVIGLFAERLARSKHPRDVVFVEALPRNAMGRIQKHEIKSMLEAS